MANVACRGSPVSKGCYVRRLEQPRVRFWSSSGDGVGRDMRLTEETAVLRMNHRTCLRCLMAGPMGMLRSAVSKGILRTVAGFGGLLWLCVYPNPAGCGNNAEYECEEAATHLEHCCQDRTSLRCEYVDSSETTTDGCTTYKKIRHIDIDLQPYSARSVRQASCDDLRTAGACRIGSWYQLETCNETRECTSSGGLSSSCGRWYVTTICKTPDQSGPCTSYRPPDACAALARLSCE